MSESKATDKKSESHATRPDFSTPFQHWMNLWRDETARMVSAYDTMTEQVVREMRRNLDETHRWMGAQLDASRHMHAIVADSARRMNDVMRQG